MARRASLEPEQPLNKLGPLLRMLRMNAAVSQKDLIARLGILEWAVQPSVISSIEKGTRSLTDRELLLILSALRKSLSNLDILLQAQTNKRSSARAVNARKNGSRNARVEPK